MGRKHINYNTAFGDSYELFRDTWFNAGFNEPTQTQFEYKDIMA